MADIPPRTMFAQKALDYSEYFAMFFKGVVVEGSCQRKPMLVAPEGMSTSGGKQAMQHLVLEPITPGPPSITVGWVDKPAMRAKIRTFPVLEALHKQRYPDMPFELDAASYLEFQKLIETFVTREKIRLDIDVRAPAAAQPPRAGKAGGGAGQNRSLMPLVILAVVLAVIAVGVAIGGVVALM